MIFLVFHVIPSPSLLFPSSFVSMKLICGWLSQGVSHEVCLVKSRTDLELAELITSASVCACVGECVCVCVRVWESEEERGTGGQKAIDSYTFFYKDEKIAEMFLKPSA